MFYSAILKWLWQQLRPSPVLKIVTTLEVSFPLTRLRDFFFSLPSSFYKLHSDIFPPTGVRTITTAYIYTMYPTTLNNVSFAYKKV